jgi:hypothetical protein
LVWSSKLDFQNSDRAQMGVIVDAGPKRWTSLLQAEIAEFGRNTIVFFALHKCADSGRI